MGGGKYRLCFTCEGCAGEQYRCLLRGIIISPCLVTDLDFLDLDACWRERGPAVVMNTSYKEDSAPAVRSRPPENHMIGLLWATSVYPPDEGRILCTALLRHLLAGPHRFCWE